MVPEKCHVCGRAIKDKKSWQKYCSVYCNQRNWARKQTTTSYDKNPKEWSKTTSGKGYRWECYAAKLLGATMAHRVSGKGADLIIDGKTVDVKSTNLYQRKNKRGKPVVGPQAGVWTVAYANKFESDLMFLVCLVDNTPVKHYLIPYSALKSKMVCIGHNSKYDRYLWPTT